jgi:hypothetical protein
MQILENIALQLHNQKSGVTYDYTLFCKINQDLQKAIRLAFHGKVARNKVMNEAEERLYNVFETNLYRFSAAKTSAEVTMLNDLFKESSSLQEMKNSLKEMNVLFNSDYLRTEYNTAYTTGLNSANYLEKAGTFKYAIWHQIDRPTKREEHEELDGQTFLVDELEAIPPVDWNCYDLETQIYTKRGWVYFKDLIKSDLVYTLNSVTKIPEWQVPINYIKKKHNGKMIEIKTTNFDCLVTPDHNMLVRKSWDGHEHRNKLSIIPANKISDSDCIYKTCKWNGIIINGMKINNRDFKIESFCKFMGWWLSEGSVTQRGENWYQISIKQQKKYNKDILRNDLKELPFKYSESKDGNFTINDVFLGKYLLKFGHCNDKFIPDEIKELQPEMIAIFLDRFIKGDGSIQKSKLLKSGYYNKEAIAIYSSSKKMIDDLSELVLKTGKSCSLSIHTKKGTITKHKNGEFAQNFDVWRLNVNYAEYFHIQKKKHIKEIDYNDMVYCVTVPKYHTLLVSRNGKIYWSGNCGCDLEYINDDSLEDEALDGQEQKQLLEDAEVPEAFLQNNALTGEIFDVEGLYEGVPELTAEGQGLSAIDKINVNGLPEIPEKEKMKAEYSIADYLNRKIETGLKPYSDMVEKVLINPDEVFLDKENNSYLYIKYFKQGNEVYPMQVTTDVDIKQGISIKNFGKLHNEKLRNNILIYKQKLN